MIRNYIVNEFNTSIEIKILIICYFIIFNISFYVNIHVEASTEVLKPMPMCSFHMTLRFVPRLAEIKTE